ncbi:hypothetical protein KL929_004337 [Ogataea haglerorum]|nr:hypothetical protein KL913_003957 [Ogataea haglerorum]KAG7716144.1 hypothetical protein KL949_004039 [Ogataea haglerorum]KAG7762526.1 hypothetical protein KL931_005329 [Ogataea haglerorum]KAG7795206.1 hypothetical protein KL929_004337 [Ogataea haglerorum]KAG7798437.1 hypothetical protein KL944_004579 [Ogataea haglerorum]
MVLQNWEKGRLFIYSPKDASSDAARPIPLETSTSLDPSSLEYRQIGCTHRSGCRMYRKTYRPMHMSAIVRLHCCPVYANVSEAKPYSSKRAASNTLRKQKHSRSLWPHLNTAASLRATGPALYPRQALRPVLVPKALSTTRTVRWGGAHALWQDLHLLSTFVDDADRPTITLYGKGLVLSQGEQCLLKTQP